MRNKRLLRYESEKFIKHYAGQHDQSTHGRRYHIDPETGKRVLKPKKTPGAKPSASEPKSVHSILLAHPPRESFSKQYVGLLADRASQDGKTPEEFSKDFDSISHLVDGAEPWSRTSQTALTKILTGGQFLSAAATNKSGAPGAGSGGKLQKYLAAREKYENLAFSYDDNTKSEDRPIYGYLSKDPDGKEGNGGIYSVNNYGAVAVHFDRDVRDRTTFTMTDSLAGGSNAFMIPQPLSHPNGKALPMYANTKTFTSLDSMGYTEAQFHGGVKSSNIKEVVFHGTPPTKTMVKLLTQHKIPYRTV